MQTTQKLRPVHVSSRQAKIQWLLSNGLPPLPVAPAQDPYKYYKIIPDTGNRGEHCPLTSDTEPVALFTGKNPSFLDANGTPHLINHHIYQSRLPSKKELKQWFADPDNGIGTLGSERVKWIDIDAKQFESQEECERAFNLLLDRKPELKLTLLEKTQSGGYRIGVKVKQPAKFTNFCLEPGANHVGECLGTGRFSVLSPTIGSSGAAYQSFYCPDRLVEIEEIDFIYPTASKESQKVSVPVSLQSSEWTPGAIPLEMLGHEESRRVLKGEDIKGDRSDSLTTAISEWQGWLNWCHANKVVVSGSVEDLAHYAGERLGIDSERVNRILKSIDLDQCHPAALYRGGDESCWQKVKRLERASFEQKCPAHLKDKEIHQTGKARPISGQRTPSEGDRLKLEVQAYLQSPDIFDKVRIKGQICSNYRINARDFNLLCQALEKQNSTPQASAFSFNDFMNQGSDALEWVIPGILPKGETVLLAALAKTGKTLLATDVAYAVLSGERVIGETPGVKGRVLLISSDESANSTRRRLRARGFDLLSEAENLQVMTHLDISGLSLLEQQLEDFRPQLVIIDSLTSITREMGISEKDAEFAQPIYKLKELLSRYGTAGILIHHENKDKEAKSINKVSGSARIVAATWGIWQLVAANPNSEKDPTRWLKVKPREGEPVTLTLEINPKDLWASQGIFNFVGEFGDETGEKKSQGERVLDLLRKSAPLGLEYREIDQFLNIGKSLYNVLDRLEDRQLISKRRSITDSRRWVYCLPQCTTSETNTTKEGDSTRLDSPPPTSISSRVDLGAEDKTVEGKEDSQQLFNTHSTTIQHPQVEDSTEKSQNLCGKENAEGQEISQHPSKDKGERGGVESSRSGSVLQNEEGLDNEIVSKPRVREEEAQPTEEEAIQIGDCIIDIITGFRGIVVAVESERIIYECQEWGQGSRRRELVMKQRNVK